MPAFKAFEWLKRLTPEQIDRFELFLQSPYFYRGKLLLSFLQYLRPFLSEEDIDEQVFSNETIFAALQPDQTFKATKVYTWKHELNELVQQFVAEESSLNTDKPINDLISILNFAVENELETGIEDSLKKIEKPLGTSIHDRPYYYNIFLTEHLKNVWNTSKTRPQNLQDQYLHLERLYAFNKIQMILTELNHSKIFNLVYDLGEHQSFLDNLVANNYWQDAILEFNYYQIQLIHQPDVALYHLLKTSLRQEMSRIHPSEVRNARVILANFCVQQMRLNNPDFYGDYLEIFLEKIEQEQQILIIEIKNIVTVALRVKDLEWVSAFLENHKHLITPVELAEHAYQYNLARVYFLQGKYEAALELLLFVKTDNIYYDVEAKILVIKILYEQINSGTLSGKKLFNKEEELELKTEGFKSYLLMTKKLDTVPTVTVEAWKGFSKFSRRIVPILLTATYNKAVKVKNDLVVAFSEGSKIVEYPWLLQKVDELVQKSSNKVSAKSKK